MMSRILYSGDEVFSSRSNTFIYTFFCSFPLSRTRSEPYRTIVQSASKISFFVARSWWKIKREINLTNKTSKIFSDNRLRSVLGKTTPRTLVTYTTNDVVSTRRKIYRFFSRIRSFSCLRLLCALKTQRFCNIVFSEFLHFFLSSTRTLFFFSF